MIKLWIYTQFFMSYSFPPSTSSFQRIECMVSIVFGHITLHLLSMVVQVRKSFIDFLKSPIPFCFSTDAKGPIDLLFQKREVFFPNWKHFHAFAMTWIRFSERNLFEWKNRAKFSTCHLEMIIILMENVLVIRQKMGVDEQWPSGESRLQSIIHAQLL